VRSDGRSAAFDLANGKMLWSSDSLLPVVTDTAAKADTLLVVGSKTKPDAGIAGVLSTPAFLAIDLRTGRVLKQLDLSIGEPRWVRLTPDALAIIGADLGVLAYDILRDRSVWRANDLAGVRTIDAWALPDRVLILDADAGLWQISLGQTHPTAIALDTRAKLTRTVLLNQPIRWALHNNNVTLTTLDGVLVYNAAGELIGADQRGDDLAVLPAAIGVEHSATVSSSPAFIEAGAKWSDLFLFNLPSGALVQRRLVELDAAPESVSLLDGRILVTAGKATLVLDAPTK
jgi:outer membrane protein assembly factor BamB